MGQSNRSAEGGSATESRQDAAAMTLESFVAELHQEGLEAGREEAAVLVQDAEREAEAIVRSARREADELLEAARAEAEQAGSRGRAELELAVRDAVLQLHAALTAVLQRLLTGAVESRLADADQLKALLMEVVGAYARADAENRPEQFTLSDDAEAALRSWWEGELQEAVAARTAPELAGALGGAGFEYRVHGATVDVSVESVVDQLMELVRPGLREVVEGAADAAIAGTGTGSTGEDDPAAAVSR